MEKKYTMKHFIEMFDKAQLETIEELNKDFENNRKKDAQQGQEAIFMLHNIMVTSTLRKNLLKKEGE